MELVQKIDDIGKPAWIGLMIVSFIIFWPVGLAVLIYLIWSGRMGTWRGASPAMARSGCGWKRHYYRPSSGNRAFDEYRADALRRLEEEQKEFTDFLERLRQARDKAEFDQFMSERKQRPSEPPAEMGDQKPQA